MNSKSQRATGALGRRWWHWCGLVAAALLFAGCATPTFTSRVSVFHAMPAQPGEDQTFEFKTAVGESDTLEHRSYRQQIKDALIAYGFREASPARYQVGFDYGVTPQTRAVVRPQPVAYPAPSWSLSYGMWGRRSGFGLGFGWPGYWYDPWPYYGAPSWVNVTQNETVQEHRLRLELFRSGATGADARVYEGTVMADAYQSDMPAVMPLMLRALMLDFPGRSGESRVVRLEIPRR